MVTEYYENHIEGMYKNLVIREEKEYISENNSILFDKEILKIKYYTEDDTIGHIKILETPLTTAYQTKMLLEIRKAKISHIISYIINQVGETQGISIHLSLLNSINEYEKFRPDLLYQDIQNLPLNIGQKEYINSLLF